MGLKFDNPLSGRYLTRRQQSGNQRDAAEDDTYPTDDCDGERTFVHELTAVVPPSCHCNRHDLHNYMIGLVNLVNPVRVPIFNLTRRF